MSELVMSSLPLMNEPRKESDRVGEVEPGVVDGFGSMRLVLKKELRDLNAENFNRSNVP